MGNNPENRFGTTLLYKNMCDRAQQCMRCPGVMHDFAFLNEHNGDPNADIMFIGEAPGTARAENSPHRQNFLIKSFWGNKTGDNFEYLLKSSGFNRDNVFVTNVVIHSPIKPSGYMRAPNELEVQNCSSWLIDQLITVNPDIVVTLGTVAFNALKLIQDHKFTMRDNIAKPISWNRRTLVPMYHPSPNVTTTWRPLSQMLQDYINLMKIVKKYGITKY